MLPEEQDGLTNVEKKHKRGMVASGRIEPPTRGFSVAGTAAFASRKSKTQFTFSRPVTSPSRTDRTATAPRVAPVAGGSYNHAETYTRSPVRSKNQTKPK